MKTHSFVIRVTLLAFFLFEGRGIAQQAELKPELDAAFKQGMALRGQGKLAQALPFFQKAATLAPQVFGTDDPSTADILSNLGSVYLNLGKYREAEEYGRRVLAIREAKLPAQDERITIACNNLGTALYHLGKYKEAEAQYKRGLNIQEKYHPNEPVMTIPPLRNLGNLYMATAAYDDAERMQLRAMALLERFYGKDHASVADVLHDLSNIAIARKMLPEAEALTRRSLTIRETKLGKDHLKVAYSLIVLGELHQEMARFKDAEAMYLRALRNREQNLDKDHPEVAFCLHNLAITYLSMNRLDEAEQLLRRCLTIRETRLGPQHSAVADTLSLMAMLQGRLGKDAESQRLYLRSVEIQEATRKNHPVLAQTLANLATTYDRQNRFKEADALYRRAAGILEKQFGPDDIRLCSILSNHAALLVKARRHGDAERMLSRALQIEENKWGKDHPVAAHTLANLGSLYVIMGNHAGGDDCLERSTKTYETHKGKECLELSFVLRTRALLEQTMKRPALARQHLDRSLAIYLTHLRSVFAFNSEAGMHDYVHANAGDLPLMLSLAAQSAGEPEAGTMALDWMLRLRGAVLDTQCCYRQAERLLDQDESLQQRMSKYRSQKALLANAALITPAPEQAEKVRKQIAQAKVEIEEHERELNRILGATQAGVFKERDKLTSAMVRQKLAPGSALIEYVSVPVRDFTTNRWKGYEYFALVLTPGRQAPQLIVLGNAAKINKGVEAVRREIADFQEKLRECDSAEEAEALEKKHEKQFQATSAALHALMFAPLRQALGGAQLLYIVPDGVLNRLSFESLVDDQGKYLIERYRCAYLSSGRDLMRTRGTWAKGTVVFAGPDFKLAAGERQAQAELLLKQKAPVVASRSMPGRETRSAGWRPLPGAAQEAQDIEAALAKSRYGPVTSHVGKAALEEVLKAMPAPRVLHLATHGFFLDHEPELAEPLEDDGAGAGSARNRLKRMDNPLLRSGIVLAGANTVGDRDEAARVEDGWVTAEEIAMLNLQGTELVVLSACQTGLGDIKSGEGVYGLRRAFLYAGAETLVTSLFEVPDRETRDLMKRFYTGLPAGDGKLRSLHAAQRAIVESRRQTVGAAHPFFWASFVLVGNPD